MSAPSHSVKTVRVKSRDEMLRDYKARKMLQKGSTNPQRGLSTPKTSTRIGKENDNCRKLAPSLSKKRVSSISTPRAKSHRKKQETPISVTRHRAPVSVSKHTEPMVCAASENFTAKVVRTRYVDERHEEASNPEAKLAMSNRYEDTRTGPNVREKMDVREEVQVSSTAASAEDHEFDAVSAMSENIRRMSSQLEALKQQNVGSPQPLMVSRRAPAPIEQKTKLSQHTRTSAVAQTPASRDARRQRVDKKSVSAAGRVRATGPKQRVASSTINVPRHTRFAMTRGGRRSAAAVPAAVSEEVKEVPVKPVERKLHKENATSVYHSQYEERAAVLMQLSYVNAKVAHAFEQQRSHAESSLLQAFRKVQARREEIVEKRTQLLHDRQIIAVHGALQQQSKLLSNMLPILEQLQPNHERVVSTLEQSLQYAPLGNLLPDQDARASMMLLVQQLVRGSNTLRTIKASLYAHGGRANQAAQTSALLSKQLTDETSELERAKQLLREQARVYERAASLEIYKLET